MTTPSTPTAGGLVSAAAQGIVASVIRAVVPLLYGAIITAATHLHFPIDTGLARTAATAATTAVVSYIVYVVGRIAERVQPKLGWLFLGFASAPVYAGSGPAAGLVRTFVPYAAGVAVVAFAKIRIDIDNGTAETLIVGLVSGAISVGWLLAGRLGETFWASPIGVMLGWLKPPAYPVQTARLVTAAPQPVVGTGLIGGVSDKVVPGA